MNNGLMRKFGDGQLHNGHYVNMCVEDSLKAISFDDFNIILTDDEDDNPYIWDTSHIFLKGSCDIFALALHKLFGYETYEIKNQSNGNLIHCYAQSTYNGKPVYIDVRGASTDFNDFYKPWYLNTNYFITPQNLENKLDCADYFDTGFKFACAIIEKYLEYYDFQSH